MKRSTVHAIIVLFLVFGLCSPSIGDDSDLEETIRKAVNQRAIDRTLRDLVYGGSIERKYLDEEVKIGPKEVVLIRKNIKEIDRQIEETTRWIERLVPGNGELLDQPDRVSVSCLDHRMQGMLTPEQQVNLARITLQTGFGTALSSGNLDQFLKLTEEQKRMVQGISQKCAYGSYPFKGNGASRSFRDESYQAFLVLDASQREKAQLLFGKPLPGYWLEHVLKDIEENRLDPNAVVPNSYMAERRARIAKTYSSMKKSIEGRQRPTETGSSSGKEYSREAIGKSLLGTALRPR